MPEIQQQQALTSWSGDIPSLVAEMKRRAGVSTDRDLAAFLGVAQSTVSHWRQRGAVPESALLKFEALTQVGGEPAADRVWAARMVAMRLAEYWFQKVDGRGGIKGRWLTYLTVAGAFNLICDAVYYRLLLEAKRSKDEASVIAVRLMEDASFMDELVSWAQDMPAHEALAREMMTPPSVGKFPAIAKWLSADEPESSMTSSSGSD
ncbi:MAG: helix-turn-helix domain containing protein [Caulobacter sp.]|nr:helix-turn-helix domain containing protein [Caulobacter sp.]